MTLTAEKASSEYLAQPILSNSPNNFLSESVPSNPSSIRDCVWVRNFSSVPAKTTISLYPTSHALLINPIKLAVLPD